MGHSGAGPFCHLDKSILQRCEGLHNHVGCVGALLKKNKFDAWFQTSAKTGKNIAECMDKLLDIIINKLNEINLNESNYNKNSLSLDPDKCSEIDKIRSTQDGCC